MKPITRLNALILSLSQIPTVIISTSCKTNDYLPDDPIEILISKNSVCPSNCNKQKQAYHKCIYHPQYYQTRTDENGNSEIDENVCCCHDFTENDFIKNLQRCQKLEQKDCLKIKSDVTDVCWRTCAEKCLFVTDEEGKEEAIVIGGIIGLSILVLSILAFLAYFFCKGKNQNQDVMETEELK